MSLNFPNTPTTGQVHNENGASWTWDGTVWVPSAGVSALIDIVGSGLPGANWTVIGDMLLCWGAGVTVAGGQLSVTFPRGFKGIPQVVATSAEPANSNIAAGTVTATSVILFAFTATTAALEVGRAIRWFAIGEALDADKKPKSIQTIGGDTVREFHDPANLASWRIIGKTLECWGTVNSATSAATTITYPKTFKRVPNLLAVANNTLDINVTAEPFSTSQARLRAFSQTGVLVAGPVPVHWRAVGEWDGVS